LGDILLKIEIESRKNMGLSGLGKTQIPPNSYCRAGLFGSIGIIHANSFPWAIG
jgi:hypothetical protein